MSARRKRTGWVALCVLDQTFGWLGKSRFDGAFTTEPTEARIIRATGREAALARAEAIMGHPVCPGRDQRDGTGDHPDKGLVDATQFDEWIEFVPDVAAFRRGPASW